MSNASHGLLGFDSIFKVLSGSQHSKKSNLDFSLMSNLCVKVAAYSLHKMQGGGVANMQRSQSQFGL